MSEPPENASARHRFGPQVRRVRRQRGWSQATLARASHVHRDLIAKIERSLRWPTRGLAHTLDAVLQADGRLLQVWHESATDDVASPLAPGRQRGLADIAEPLDEVAERLWRLDSQSRQRALGLLESIARELETDLRAGEVVGVLEEAVRLRHRVECLLARRLSLEEHRSLLDLARRASASLSQASSVLGLSAHAAAYATETSMLAGYAGGPLDVDAGHPL